LGEILVNDGLASKEQVFDALTAQQHQPEPKTPLGEILLQAKAITERALDQALHKQEKTPKPAEEDATIRVETKRLDSVMNLVGELVLGRNRLIKIGTQLEQQHESDPQVRVLERNARAAQLGDHRLAAGRHEDAHAGRSKKCSRSCLAGAGPFAKAQQTVHLEMRGEETELDKSRRRRNR
jgi:two-component system chemotaxis sensor kinase CheA